MDLSPNDIRNYEFNTQMRGFDKEEVESFLEQVATTLEDLKQDLLKKTFEFDSLQKRYNELKECEDTIKSAAIDARRNADQTIKGAKEEAAALISDAQTKAENLIHDKAHEFKKIEAQISNLEETKISYVTELKTLIESHLMLVEEVANAEFELPEVAIADFEVTESTDITVEKRETIANTLSQDDSEPNTIDDNVGSEQGKTENDNVDPELENALKNYQHKLENDSKTTAQNNQPMFGPERVVETSSRADDIPEGFIAGNQDGVGNANDTARINDYSKKSSQKNNMSDTGPLKPEELAEELD
ncbi:MAG: DivIVA domain-containing protein, partial [bacterium]